MARCTRQRGSPHAAATICWSAESFAKICMYVSPVMRLPNLVAGLVNLICGQLQKQQGQLRGPSPSPSPRLLLRFCAADAGQQQRLICCGADNLLMLIEPQSGSGSRTTAIPLHGCCSIIASWKVGWESQFG